MPYVLPSDLATRRLAGDYIRQSFPIPRNSLAGDYRSSRVALSGAVVPEIYTQPPYRTLGQSWFEQETLPGVKNMYLVGGLGLLLLLGGIGGKRRRR